MMSTKKMVGIPVSTDADGVDEDELRVAIDDPDATPEQVEAAIDELLAEVRERIPD